MAQEDLNRIALRNSTQSYSVDPPCRDSSVNGTAAPDRNHSAEMNTKYNHWCRPEPTKEFPWKSADLERAKEKQGGMQDDTQGLKRAESGGVKGSQVGARPEGPHFTKPWGEYNDLDQWDKEQEHTYDREENEPFDRT